MDLLTKGTNRVDRDRRDMPVLSMIKESWSKTRPLDGYRISACLHITTQTAVLIETLLAGGAKVSLCASNPLSTQDDVVEYLSKKIHVYGKRGDSVEKFHENLRNCMSHGPHIIIDDGCDMTKLWHENPCLSSNLIGICEETTTGVIRLRALEKDGMLKVPAVAVNDSRIKHLFDNRYGTGQSTLDGIIRATNKLITGTTFVVVGYGLCGQGLATRAKGMGAKVIVVEVDPVKSLQAYMDGFHVMTMDDAAMCGDIFCTVTGCIKAIDLHHIEKMKDGAIICNSGHFDVEINLKDLADKYGNGTEITPDITEYTVNGKTLYVLGEGRLVNLACANGHPSCVMDTSFSGQAMAAKWIIDNQHNLDNKVYNIPSEIEDEIAEMKLSSLGVTIQRLTEEQKVYLNSWQIGT